MTRYQVPFVEFENGRILKPGQRVRINSRHGTVGTGTIVTLHVGDHPPPPMAILKMDEGTVYSTDTQEGWPDDETRIREYGVFGGEIEEILSEPIIHEAPQRLQ